jgi:hypothetical protein
MQIIEDMPPSVHTRVGQLPGFGQLEPWVLVPVFGYDFWIQNLNFVKTNLGKNGLELGVDWQLTVPELELGVDW